MHLSAVPCVLPGCNPDRRGNRKQAVAQTQATAMQKIRLMQALCVQRKHLLRYLPNACRPCAQCIVWGWRAGTTSCRLLLHTSPPAQASSLQHVRRNHLLQAPLAQPLVYGCLFCLGHSQAKRKEVLTDAKGSTLPPVQAWAPKCMKRKLSSSNHLLQAPTACLQLHLGSGFQRGKGSDDTCNDLHCPLCRHRRC